MLYLYARVSTDKQDADNQIQSMVTLYPEGVVIRETASGTKHRPQLDHACEALGPGDVLCVAAIDRLGRSTLDILERIQSLVGRGVRIHSLREGFLDQTPSGRFL